MNKTKLLTGVITFIISGAVAVTIQAINKRKKEDVMELEVLHEETIEG